MTELVDDGLSAEERVRAELRSLRMQVSGIHGSMVATSDGLLVTHDLPDVEPTRVAALVATTLGLARQATRETGCGEFREAVARGSAGYLAVYAAGASAVVAVIGTNDLNVGILQFQIRDMIKRVAACSAEFSRFKVAERPSPHPPLAGSTRGC